MILQVAALASFTPRQQLQFMKEVVPILSADKSKAADTVSGINFLLGLSKKGRRLNRKELIFKLQFEKQMDGEWTAVRDAVVGLAENAGADGLVEALETGLLELPVFTPKKSEEDQTDGMISQYFDVIGKAVSDGATYPLLDDQTSNLVSAGIDAGKLTISNHSVSRGKHAGLVASLFEKLPLFNEASIHNILEIRSELEKPLIRFRSTISSYSSQIESAQWNPDFVHEADDLFTKDVAPAILELEEVCKASSLLRSLAKKLGEPLELPKSSFIGLMISSLGEFGHWTKVIMGSAAGAANLTNDAYQEWKTQQQNIERSQLYFYYRTGKRLEEIYSAK